MKILLRMQTLLLVLCLALPLAACGGKTDPGNETAEKTDPPDTGDGLHDSDGYLLDHLPDSLDYGKEKINILYWNNAPTYEFSTDSDTALTTIENAVFARNSNVEERLNVVLNFIGRDGDGGHQTSFLRHLDSTVGKSTENYDLVASYTMVGGAMMVRGYCLDLMQTDYFDPDMPWWPDNLTAEALVENRLYFASGDLSTNLLWSMFAVLYNRDLMESYTLTETYDPDEAALNGAWTLPLMMEMASVVSGDIDGAEGKTEKDRFGFTTLAIYGDSFFFGSGLRTTERNDDGLLTISPTFGSEKTQTLLTKLADFFATDSAWLAYNDNDWFLQPYFAQGNVLFDLRPIYYLHQVLNAEGSSYRVDFGILPVPKYDESQTSYVTTVGFTYSLWSIPRDVSDRSRASAVLEALGSAAYRTTTPAVFVTTMQKRYSKDDSTSRIFDLIRSTASFDIGRLLCSSFNLGNYNNATYRMFRSALGEGDRSWTSTYKGEESALQDALAGIVAKLREIP